MARIFFALVFVLTSSSVAWAAPRAGELPYYGSDFYSSRSVDIDLKEKLFQILSQAHISRANDFDQITVTCAGAGCYRHTPVGYTRAREFIMGDFYLVKNGATFGLKDLYCERIADALEFKGQKPAPNIIPDATVMNTEHTWPQSKFVKGVPQDFQKSDMHHLFPTDSQVNADRSSFEFGEVETDLRPLKCAISRLGTPASGGRTVFEPPQAHKGNVARAMFYFAVRYHAVIDRDEEATLREWNRADPVDAEEKARNEKIFLRQFDRNPFVDYPELSDRIRDF